MEDEFVIDAGPMGGSISGAGRYAFHLLDELVKLDTDIQFRIIVPPPNSFGWDISEWSTHENVQLETADMTGVGPKRHLYYLRNRPKCKAHHSLSSYVPIMMTAKQTLVTVHDLKYFKIPEVLQGKSRLKQTYIRRFIKRSVRVADHVITVSEHTKEDIVDKFDLSPETISVVPLGPGGGLVEADGEPPVAPPYILFVGSVRRHKNIETLLRGFQRYRRQGNTDLSAAIVGSTHPSYQPELEAEIDEEYQNDIHFLGHVGDKAVARLYNHAEAFVFPSLYEGFGLPPLEAMGYGTPVIAANRTSIPEVVDDAGVYFDPTDPDDLSKALACVLEDEERRTQLVERGYDRYDQFSWARTARETLEIYQRVWD